MAGHGTAPAVDATEAGKFNVLEGRSPRVAPVAAGDKSRARAAQDLAETLERHVIGALLVDDAAPLDCVEAGDFAMPRHRLIFAAIKEARDLMGTGAPLQTANVLEHNGRLADAGGWDYVQSLADETSHSGCLAADAVELREHACRRKLADIGQRISCTAREGGDVAALLDEAQQLRIGTKSRGPTIVEDIGAVENLPPLRWLVKGLLPANCIGMLVAPPNVGKTTVAVGVSMCIAAGVPWCGMEVAEGGVLIVSGEGRHGIGARSRAWRTWAGATQTKHAVEVAHGLPALSAPLGIAELRRIVGDFAGRHGSPPALVVIDTLAVHWAESEDKAEFVGPCMAALRTIADGGTSVLLLHHVRKPSNGPTPKGDAWAGVRGSGAWVGAADVVLSLDGGPDALVLSVTKQRDAQRAASVPLALRMVNIAADGAAPEQGPVAVRAEAMAEAVREDGSDEAATRKLVEAVRKLGGTPTTRDAVVTAAGLRANRGRALLDLATATGLIVATDAGRRKTIYTAPAVPSRCAAGSHTLRDGGTAKPSPSLAVRDGGGTAGRRDGECNREGAA